MNRRRDAQDATQSFISQCEDKFWKVVSTGLFFRRRYSVGQEVEVLLCKGLDSQAGRIASVREDETYDVDLEPSSGISGNATEIGVRIPPEYLRPKVSSRNASHLDDDNKKALRATVVDLCRQRQALRDELAALTREMEALERQPLEPSNILPTLGDTATQNSSSEVKTRRLLGEPTAEVSNTKAKATERSDAELESEKGIPQARCWLGSLSCGGQPFEREIASTVLPLLNNADIGEGVDSRLDHFDVVAVALQDCDTSSEEIADILRDVLLLDDDNKDSDWCMIAVESGLHSTFSASAKAASLTVFLRREVLFREEKSLEKASAAADSGLSTVAVYVQLRDGEKLAILSANTNSISSNKQVSMDTQNAHVNAHFSIDAMDSSEYGMFANSTLDASRGCDHALFIGDLGYSYDLESGQVGQDDLSRFLAVSDWAALSSADALREEQSAHRVFCGKFRRHRYFFTVELRLGNGDAAI